MGTVFKQQVNKPSILKEIAESQVSTYHSHQHSDSTTSVADPDSYSVAFWVRIKKIVFLLPYLNVDDPQRPSRTIRRMSGFVLDTRSVENCMYVSSINLKLF